MDTSNLFRVDGLVAVVTGGGTGIGLVMSKALIGAGASKVYILGRRKDVLDRVAAEHQGLIAIECDVTSKESLQKAVDHVSEDTGYINILVANSGTIGPTARLNFDLPIHELRKSVFEGVAVDDFTQTLHVNVTGAYYSMLAFLELLDAGNKAAVKGGFGRPLKQGSNVPSIQSQVVFTSSLAAYSRNNLTPPAYAASKAALSHLAKHSSTNLAKYEIRVNALVPGLFPTELAVSLTASRDPATESINDPAYIPARRFGEPEEMAGAILYLASRAGSFCNGLILVNDGGRLSIIASEY